MTLTRRRYARQEIHSSGVRLAEEWIFGLIYRRFVNVIIIALLRCDVSRERKRADYLIGTSFFGCVRLQWETEMIMRLLTGFFETFIKNHTQKIRGQEDSVQWRSTPERVGGESNGNVTDHIINHHQRERGGGGPVEWEKRHSHKRRHPDYLFCHHQGLGRNWERWDVLWRALCT